MTSKIFCKTRLASTRTRDWNFFGEFSAGIDFPMSLKVDSTVEHLEYLWFHSRGIIERIRTDSTRVDLELLLLLWEKGKDCFLYFYKGGARNSMFENSDKLVITLMIFTRTRCACFNCTILTSKTVHLALLPEI